VYQRMKGTYDVIEDAPYFRAVERAASEVSRLFNFKEIRTPLFEASELFHRSVGETTDIVSKETYDFTDRGGRRVTLRPEGTAGVVRAYIENKLHADPRVPGKYYYLGTMYRYDRPQKGRTREFRQFGVESFGTKSPAVDAETLAAAHTFFRALKLQDALTLHINTLGGRESKANYAAALRAHLEPHVETLCADCQRRYQDNPLRILDCKIDGDSEAVQNAPRTLDHLAADDRKNFEEVLSHLDALQIDYVVDHALVRGLDYYTHTVYEFKVDAALLGSQNAIGGGGRYDELVETLGGPPTPATGFGIGLERLIHVLKQRGFTPREGHVHLYLLAIGEEARRRTFTLAHELRLGGLVVETDLLGRSVKAQFKQSEHHQAAFVGILGETELAAGTINLKDQATQEEQTLKQSELLKTIKTRLNGRSKAPDCSDCTEKGSQK